MDPAHAGASGAGVIFRSLLRYRNYRLYFTGHGLSLVGSWMTRLASGWLIFRLTGSPWMLGLVLFLTQGPALFLAPVGGVLLERCNLRRVLVLTQSLAALCSLVMAGVLLSGSFADAAIVTTLLVISLCRGVINAFDLPARQSFISQIIEDRQDLSNAIALNSSMVHGSRMIGPMVAGLIIARNDSEGMCYLIDAVSYLSMIIGLLSMRLTPRKMPIVKMEFWRDFAHGVRYVASSPPIRAILLLVSIVSLTGAHYATFLTMFVRSVLQRDADVQGLLLTCAGTGALCGALYLASRRSVRGLKTVIVLGSGLLGLSLIALSLCQELWLCMPILGLTGFAMMIEMAACNTFLQTIVDEDKRSRVMGLYTMAQMGVAPFGGLLAGALATRIGASGVFLVGGICCAFTAAAFATQLPRLRELVYPIYRTKGVAVE